MSALNPYLTLPQSFQNVYTWATQQLSKVGLQFEQTFDLQAARVSHAGCTCPHHGTHQCSCQMVVLLIRDERNDPITLILHGNDGHTSLSIGNLNGRHTSPNLDATIRLALISHETTSSWWCMEHEELVKTDVRLRVILGMTCACILRSIYSAKCKK